MTQPSPATSPSVPWIEAVRASHQRLTGLLGPLDADGIRARSYDDEWTIAQVTSHLGSQAEIFGLFLEAGLAGDELPGSEKFQEIWGRWDSSSPERQVARSIEANEGFLARVEGLSADQRDGFRAALFGNQADLVGLLAMRLPEHAVHTWDIAVALDPSATVAPDAVALILDTALPRTAARGSKPGDPPLQIAVHTTDPERYFVLTTGPEVSLAPTDGAPDAGEGLDIPAEALLRLVFGRLDPEHTPDALRSQEDVIARLRPVFPGF